MKKLRINMIIGKKHLIIAGLAVVLAVGLFANFAISNSIEATPTGANPDDANFVSTDISGGDSSESDTLAADEYFAAARMDKQNSREKAVETLRTIYQGGDRTEDELTATAADAEKLTELMESETKIETMLKAQGFEDVLCYLSGGTANIIVKTDGLDTAQAAQIKSALLSEVEVASEDITIVEVN